jgi:hypothetical protein
MKKLKLLLFGILCLALMGSFTLTKTPIFKVEIWQNGVLAERVDSIYVLEKKPFQIKVFLINHEGVFMNASYSTFYYQLLDNELVPDLQNLPSKTFAESTFNTDKDLILDLEGVSYLFYKKKQDWHRFDKQIEVNDDKVIGTKTIEHLFLLESNNNIDISEVDQPIYFFFAACTDGKKIKELKREKFMIQWKK